MPERDDPIEEALAAVERVALSDAYDEPSEQRRRPDATNGTPPALEETLGPELTHALDAVSRSVGYAVAGFTVELSASAEAFEPIIQEVMRRMRAELLAAAKTEQETFDTKEAAAFLRTSEQRIYDLVSQRKLVPEFKDGTKNIFQRKELEAYLRGEGTRGRKR